METSNINHILNEEMMVTCTHNLDSGTCGYSTCILCGWSELMAYYNMYNNNKLN